MAEIQLDEGQRTKLATDTDERVSALEKRAGTSSEERLAELQQQFEDAAQIRDESEREARIKVLQANFTSIKAEIKAEQEDLGMAMLGLDAILSDIEGYFEDLEKPSQEERAVIDRAKQRLEDAEAALEEAKNARYWFSSKEEAVAAAQAEVDAAKQGVEDAEAKANQMARERLMSADIAENLQRFMLRHERVTKIMQARTSEIEAERDNVRATLTVALAQQEEKTTELTQHESELARLEGEVQAAEALRDAFEVNTKERAQHNTKVETLRQEMAETRGKVNESLAIVQAAERFSAELAVHLRTQQSLLDNHKMWIEVSTVEQDLRRVTIQSRLSAMQGAADQMAASSMGTVGREVDQSNIEKMAQIGYASDDLATSYLEKQPEWMEQIDATRAAAAEGHRMIRERQADVLEKFKDQYGIDPTRASEFSYASDGEGAASAA